MLLVIGYWLLVIWLFYPLDMGPKFFHVVLYEYLRVFLNNPLKILHSKKWKKYLWF